MSFYQASAYFLIYAFVGWCVEVAYAASCEGRFVNRGFLNGPVCPIYGVGMVTVLFILAPVQDNPFWLFAGGMIFTSVIELATGWALERIFHQRWWDYSDMPFNIGGYVCLKFSMLWGAGCVLAVRIIHPLVVRAVGIVPHMLGVWLMAAIFAVLAADTAATANTVFRLNMRLKNIDELTANIKRLSDELGEGIYEGTVGLLEKRDDMMLDMEMLRAEASMQNRENMRRLRDGYEQLKARYEEARDRYEELLNRWEFGHKRLLNAFPQLRNADHSDALRRLRESLLSTYDESIQKMLKNNKI